MIDWTEMVFPEEALLLGGGATPDLKTDGLLEHHHSGLRELAAHAKGPWVAVAIASASPGSSGDTTLRLGLWHSRVGTIIDARAFPVSEGVPPGLEDGGGDPGEEAPLIRRQVGHDGRCLFLEQGAGNGLIRFRLDLSRETVAGINVEWGSGGRMTALRLQMPLMVPAGATVTVDSSRRLDPSAPVAIRQRLAIEAAPVGSGGYTLMIPSGSRGYASFGGPATIGPGGTQVACVQCEWEPLARHGFGRFVIRVD